MSVELSFDCGIKEFVVNGGGILKFNPSDPNLYKRFKNLGEQIAAMEKEPIKEDEDGVETLAKYDQRVKEMLTRTFGEWNDFDSIFNGISVMGIANNGELTITNFLNAIRPIIDAGVKEYARAEAQKAVQKANAERNAR